MRNIAHNFIDRSGQVFNGWTIIEYVKNNKFRKPMYLCRCICGKEKISILTQILKGNSKSCGCLNIVNHTHHGLSATREYKIWINMKKRCYNKNYEHYHRYGGRGIIVCDKWVDDFKNFIQDMGYAPTDKHSIDRINNDGNYKPSNCRWATQKEQCNNRSKPLPSPPLNQQ